MGSKKIIATTTPPKNDLMCLFISLLQKTSSASPNNGTKYRALLNVYILATNGSHAITNNLGWLRAFKTSQTPNTTNMSAILASNPARESCICHGETASNKELRSAIA